MSGDIALQIRTDDAIDMLIVDNDLDTDEGLQTAILVSLFSDKRIDQDEVEEGISDRRGWWGDEFPDVEGDEIGSKLWLLDRSKIIQETLNRAQEYAADALQWMLTDGVASKIVPSAVFVGTSMVLTILIYQPGKKEPYKFTKKWNTEADRER